MPFFHGRYVVNTLMSVPLTAVGITKLDREYLKFNKISGQVPSASMSSLTILFGDQPNPTQSLLLKVSLQWSVVDGGMSTQAPADLEGLLLLVVKYFPQFSMHHDLSQCTH